MATLPHCLCHLQCNPSLENSKFSRLGKNINQLARASSTPHPFMRSVATLQYWLSIQLKVQHLTPLAPLTTLAVPGACCACSFATPASRSTHPQASLYHRWHLAALYLAAPLACAPHVQTPQVRVPRLLHTFPPCKLSDDTHQGSPPTASRGR
jgi:hypothetical protein